MPKEPQDKAVTGPRYRTKQTAKKSTGAPAPHIDLIRNIQAPPANGKRTARLGTVRAVTASPALNPPLATNKEVSGADKDNHHNVRYHFPPRIHELNTVASGV